MRVGIIGTGAIAHKHAQVYANIGYSLVACAASDPARARAFADRYGCAAATSWQDLCRADLDIVDVCRFPDFRLPVVELCAREKKHVQVEKPIATNTETARRMIDVARGAGILLNVVSQHRFDESAQFLKRAIDAGRLGKRIEADAYVKWYRPPEYYARPAKGSWAVEGGGALINQGIHQADLLLWLVGPVARVTGEWQLGAAHRIESEDVVNAVLRYASGATGVIQASTAFRPGFAERLEFHGTRGTAVITGDQLTVWDVDDDGGEPPPLARAAASGASEPMAISLVPFERQFLDFGEAIRAGRQSLVSGEEGYRALELVESIYRSCREGTPITIQR
ncbi:MAG: Gfo/Idh/MocA family oxidoreductase [Acidobacteriia bacterium]|nr:Gfo/Idh/MocA family oxidoreductase [Terriglobia bacterium]